MVKASNGKYNTRLAARIRVVNAYEQCCTRSMSAIAKKAGVTPKVATRWLPVYKKTGSVEERDVVPGPKPGSHNLAKTAIITQGVESMRGIAGVSAGEAAACAGVHPATMRRAAHRTGLTWGCKTRRMKLSASDRKRRLAFAKSHTHKYDGIAWRNAFYVDATAVWTAAAHSASGAQQNPPNWDFKHQHKGQDTSAHSSKLMAYAGICRYGATPLIFVTGTSGMTSKYLYLKGRREGQPHVGCCGREYLNDVMPKLREQATAMFARHRVHQWLYVHDRAPTHKSANTFLQRQNKAVVTDWMVSGADVNPIENAWAELKREVPKHIERNNIVIADCAHFQTVLQTVWKNITTEKYLKSLCTDVPKRLREVIEQQGGGTRH